MSSSQFAINICSYTTCRFLKSFLDSFYKMLVQTDAISSVSIMLIKSL